MVSSGRVAVWTFRTLWILAAVEVGAWVACWNLSGIWLGPASIRARQLESRLIGLADLGALPSTAAAAAEQQREDDLLGREALHPYLGFVSRLRVGTDGERFTWMQGDGLTDRRSPVYRDEPFVLGITGGSVAAQVASTGMTRLLMRLDEAQRLQGEDVHVLVFANAGFKQPQQHLALAYLLDLGVRFDAVINLDGFNEVAMHQAANEAQGVSVAWPLDWASRRTLLEENALGGELRYLESERRDLARTALEGGWFQSTWLGRSLWLARDTELAAKHSEARRAVERAATPSSGRAREWTGPRWPTNSADGIAQDLVALWMRSSRNMRAACEAAGAVYVHALQPNQHVEGSKPLTREEEDLALASAEGLRREVQRSYPLLQQGGLVLRGEGEHFFDLTNMFRDRGETLYEDPCCHLNTLGRLLLAEAMAGALLASLPDRAEGATTATGASSDAPVGDR